MTANALDERASVIRALVAEWTDGEGHRGTDVSAEVAAWLALPADQRAVVSDRLHAFVQLDRSIARRDVGRVADALGLGRANAYRLLKRMEEVGPVSGLITHKRTAGKRSPVRDGFGAPWDGWIEKIIADRPDVAVPTLRKDLLRLAEASSADIGSSPPEVTALRRRVDRIRATVGEADSEPVGNELLVDSVSLSAVVIDHGDEKLTRPLAMTVVLDVGSGLVVGHAVFYRAPLQALSLSVASVSVTLPGLARSGAPIANGVGLLRVGPADLEGNGSWIGGLVPAGRRPAIYIDISADGRSGKRLIRRIGSRIGGFGLSILRLDQRGRPVAPTEGTPSTYSTLDDAAYAVEVAVSRWNSDRMAKMVLVGGRGRPAAVARAEALAEDVRLAFLPATARWENIARRVSEFSRRSLNEG